MISQLAFVVPPVEAVPSSKSITQPIALTSSGVPFGLRRRPTPRNPCHGTCNENAGSLPLGMQRNSLGVEKEAQSKVEEYAARLAAEKEGVRVTRKGINRLERKIDPTFRRI